MPDPTAGSRHLTLEQIGERAGVSRSTVSRVLNGRPDVRPEVRARVEAVIAETGYHPNPAARALVSQRSGLIGLVMLTDVAELFGDPYYSALVNGIQQGCAEFDLIFSIFPTYSPDGESDALTPHVAHGFIDGVIVTAVPGSDELITRLHDRGKPMVVIGRPAEADDLPRVDVENRAGGAGAVRHLLDHGRRTIAFVGGTAEFAYSSDRYAGYRDALADAGIELDDRLVGFDKPTVDGGYRAAREVLAAKPDAIFAATDSMAAGAYRALREAGLAIPDDVAVVGFDGLPRAAALDPPLTTVVQPATDLGRVAVELLAGGDPKTVTLPTTLHLGESCGEHSPADG